MGTYTTNYQLYMPTIGEQGWGELVNNNFTTIDTTMNSLSNRIGILEPLSVIQVDENQNVTFPAKVSAIGGFILSIPVKLTIGDTQNAYYTYNGTSIDNPGTTQYTLFTIPVLKEHIGLIHVSEITGVNLTVTATGANNGPRNDMATGTMTFYANGVAFMSITSGRSVSLSANGTAIPKTVNGNIFVNGSESITVTCSADNYWGYNTAYKQNSTLTVDAFVLSYAPNN